MISGRAAAGPGSWPFAGRHTEIARFAGALSDPSCRGFSIRGDAGTGKTALAGACLDLVTSRGLPFIRVDATVTSAAVPLASVAHLMTADLRSAEPAVLFAAVLGRLEQRVAEAGVSRLVVLVDDIGLLDPTSLALVATVAGSARLFLITTDRSDRPDPDALNALWRAGSLVGVDLEGFSRDELGRVLHIVLQAPVSAQATEALWIASAGNPLFLRELVHEAVQRGTLREIDGVWQLTGALEPGPRLLGFVESRLRELDPGARGLLDRLAACGPLPLPRVLELLDHDAVSELEVRGLVSVHSDGSALQVDVSHPVHRQALRRLLPVSTASRLLLEESERVAEAGSLSDTTVARLVSWRLAAGAPIEPGPLLHAARLARYSFDFPTVLRMTAAAGLDDQQALSLHCEALYLLNRPEEAVEAAAAVLSTTAGGPYRGALVATSMMALFSGLARLQDASGLAEREIAAGTSAADEARATLAVLYAYAGRTSRADETIAAVPAEGRLAVDVHLVAAASALATGDGDRVIAEAQVGATALRRLGDAAVGLPHPLVFHGLQVAALHGQGHLDEAEKRADTVIRDATSAGGQVAHAQLSALLAGVQLAQGKVTDALHTARDAVSSGYQDGISHGRLLGWATIVQAQVMLRAQGEAATAAVRMRELPDDGGHYACVPRAEAWLLAGAGELGQARELLVAAADTFAALGQPATALGLLSEAVRFGSRGLSSGLAALAGPANNPLTAVRVAHAAAHDSADIDGIVAAADGYGVLGFVVHQAECLTEAATLCIAAGESRRGRALGARAGDRRAAAGSCWTPGLVAVPAHVPLTSREHEIAVLAAVGQTSAVIAAKLFLSVRTVDNHLRSVYSKTGANGREDLAAMLDLATGAG